MEMVQIVIPIVSVKKLPESVEKVLEDVLKHENLIEGVKRNILTFLIAIIYSLKEDLVKYTINNISSEKIKRPVKKLKKKDIEEFEKRILLTLLYFDYWRIRYYEEEGLTKYIEKAMKNIEASYYYIELLLWYLLYLKNKNKVTEYKEHIESLIEKINKVIVEFIPEEEISEEELRIIEESLKEECVKIKDLRL